MIFDPLHFATHLSPDETTYFDSDQRIGSAAAAGLARLFLNYGTFLANRACARAAQPLSTGAGVSRKYNFARPIVFYRHSSE